MERFLSSHDNIDQVLSSILDVIKIESEKSQAVDHCEEIKQKKIEALYDLSTDKLRFVLMTYIKFIVKFHHSQIS